jgi:hypothetical protein
MSWRIIGDAAMSRRRTRQRAWMAPASSLPQSLRPPGHPPRRSPPDTLESAFVALVINSIVFFARQPCGL